MVSGRREAARAVILVAEVLAVVLAVLLDVLIPTLVILLLATASLAARRERPSTLGFHRVAHPWRLVWQMAAFAVVWTLIHVALFIPVLSHLTGQEQDVSDFEELEGNVTLLVVLLLLSWTLAAVGEEAAYRGYLQTRLTQLIGASGLALVVSIACSSVLFGLAHTEQGVVGVSLATIDGIAYCVLRYQFATLWASVLAHGFINTIGMVSFFIVGPIYAFW